jgi:predicted transcriptional regulator
MKKKRHTAEEISVKLHQAEEMASEGKFQDEIAHALGVSVMTYHRWRKARQSLPAVSTLINSGIIGHSVDARLGDLQLENSRLRRLVTNLLLEKVILEEELSVPRDRNLTKQAR